MKYDTINSMEYINLRKLSTEALKQVRSQIVQLKKMGKSGKETEELTKVRLNRISEIWTAYLRYGDSVKPPNYVPAPLLVLSGRGSIDRLTNPVHGSGGLSRAAQPLDSESQIRVSLTGR